ncbi:MAG: pyridoxamine 5'-phosphate oxidase [Acidobacteria bacterium]|nr:pyridoxamine 5'-phosphate oxidase [Acidobacteriota bacterium]
MPEHSSHELDAQEPIGLFDQWLADAERSEPNDPNAAALATASSDGAPSVRMVLVKRVQAERFCFFTNCESRKGCELEANRHVALCFHWKSLRRQVRVEGEVQQLDANSVDAYFHSRSRRSQIGAAVSDQSRILSSRADLEERVRRFSEANQSEIPRPPYWRGFRIYPMRIEFWISGDDRLHDRFLFTRSASAWNMVRLFP